MSQVTEQLAVEIGTLLAESSLDQRIKDAILERLDTLPEDLVFKLKDALTREQEELDAVIFDVELFMKEQDERWAKLEADQQSAASGMTDELFEKLKDHPATDVPADASKEEVPPAE